MDVHPFSLVEPSLKLTARLWTSHHLSPLLSLLDYSSNLEESEAYGGSSLDTLMDPDDMSGPQELLGELLVTVVTLEPVHLAQVILLMFNEELL